ncbi:glycerate kinase [Cohnella terricola]|uniref:Glycerate kinase n=1 Tax=Cohnella terricola TaxID=1289167 RepID=A0A559JEN1_9BACL|nr:glycerate kinase [Cohnella terricola]TVX98325.1 glycerate kinase [Cohnella terricola]
MKIVLAPDSYKGSLTAARVCSIIERAMKEELPDADIVSIPMADGGEGTVDAIVRAASGRIIEMTVSGPLGLPIQTCFGDISQNSERCAIIEVASLFGLPMLAQEARDPLNTTSRGLGDAIRVVLDMGYRRLYIGLGGSSTNDGGMGMLSALGARFYSGSGEELRGFGRDLAALNHIDLSGLDPRLAECTLIAASDVTNPLLGPQGATHVYGPQKGADSETVEMLDEAMGKYADLLESAMRIQKRDSSGAGAAGGIGFALMSIGAQIRPGAEVVGMLCGLDEHIQASDWVLTGEGSSDGQTLYGKLPIYVARRASAAGKPTLLLSGSLGDNWQSLLPYFTGCISTVTRPSSLEESLLQAERNLDIASRNAARLLFKAQSFPK